MPALEFPNRYEPLAALGKGGGGEVWAVRDRYTGARFALKVLASTASEAEMAALVREAVALSGLEGLGLPRVVRFGRLPASELPFMVRELVEGKSLEQMINDGAELEPVLDALARAADQLTVLHRAGLLHGDIKPANIIVTRDGSATLVDLGLAAPWREGGARVEGLTPRYAAPELFEGKPLTVRAEVYALGVALEEALEQASRARATSEGFDAMREVSSRATSTVASDRYPSADEFASALRRAARLSRGSDQVEDAALWPIVGIESTSLQLLELVRSLGPGQTLRMVGPAGSGRSALLRRLAWSLGIEGHPISWIDESLSGSPEAILAELGVNGVELVVLVDNADVLDATCIRRLSELREEGARLVLVGGESMEPRGRVFEVPPLERHASVELLHRAVPSLTERSLDRVLEVTEGRPGELRQMVRMMSSEVVASPADIERMVGATGRAAELPEAPLDRAAYFLDRGRFNDAARALDAVRAENEPQRLALTIARARLELSLGEASTALGALRSVEPILSRVESPLVRHRWSLYLGRALIGVGDLTQAMEVLASIAGEPGELGAEALAFQGLAMSFAGLHAEAESALETAVGRASEAGSARIEALALASLGLAAQRDDRLDAARQAYERAIIAAERASDAGTLATVQLNLAGLLKVGGDIAKAIEHFEAAVDMGRRSGRRSTARQALLNLANTDLYLGRLARAQTSIEALQEQRALLPAVMRAQLSGLQAELSARTGHLELAARQFEACAAAYEALGRNMDAAESRLEGVLLATRSAKPDTVELKKQLERARAELAESPAHRPLFSLASARVEWLCGAEQSARTLVDEALSFAREAGQREWVWRALESRAELSEAGGQSVAARRDREEALAVLEDIGARLPRDLREVYWNDPRRRQLRSAVSGGVGMAATQYLPLLGPLSAQALSSPLRSAATLAAGGTSVSATSMPPEQRLARILEINSELAGLLDLDHLTARITDFAVNLVRAERGFVLLTQPDGSLSIHTSRSASGDEPHAEFSRSIAQTVIATGEPVVSLSARDDSRMKLYPSVHQMMLQSVACVPVRAPSGAPIGALYLETRLKPGAHFERELPTLAAFADQMAIAIENARLINENRRRADELERANSELEEAQDRLRELLGDRTAKLKAARRKLRDARDALYGHFGYQGLVGTSAPMRRVYALIERVRDTDVPVLITGESGTGKEVVARAIHAASPRAKKRLLGLNCGAIPEPLLESELFGHVRGAFTGADRERRGLFRECEGGSILLDEIGEMPPKMQASLLRVLQDQRVRSVGGTHEETVDVRLLFATNRELGKLVEAGKFREDLYYRIHVVELRLPPLRERREDIPQLVDHFAGLFAARYKRERKAVSRDAMRRLLAYDWPGNVRQLEHVLINAWVLSERPELESDDLDVPDGYVPSPSAAVASAEPDRVEPASPRETAVRLPRTRHALSQHRMAERERILQALQASNWNRVRAAELSGIPRRTFYRRLREYGIQ
ncbi:MAG TPA: sigma 54-interacting transcriptional regulator [Polyangiaceae bacterium]